MSAVLFFSTNFKTGTISFFPVLAPLRCHDLYLTSDQKYQTFRNTLYKSRYIDSDSFITIDQELCDLRAFEEN